MVNKNHKLRTLANHETKMTTFSQKVSTRLSKHKIRMCLRSSVACLAMT